MFGEITPRLRSISPALTYTPTTVTFNATVSSPGTASASEHFGALSSATGINNVALGASATTGGPGSIAIGTSSTASQASGLGIAIGYLANNTTNGSVVIGQSAASTGGANAVAIGSGTAASFNFSIALGVNSATTAANQLVIGSAQNITEAYIGGGVTSATPPASVKILTTGGSGSNIAASDMILAAGKGTGTGAGGTVRIQTSILGTTGSTLQTLTDRVTADNLGNVNLSPGASQLATNATNGFTYVPSCAGIPTGVPASLPGGGIPMVLDTSTPKLWFYTGGAWKGVAIA